MPGFLLIMVCIELEQYCYRDKRAIWNDDVYWYPLLGTCTFCIDLYRTWIILFNITKIEEQFVMVLLIGTHARILTNYGVCRTWTVFFNATEIREQF